jgi:uncharacterized protein DUF2846
MMLARYSFIFFFIILSAAAFSQTAADSVSQKDTTVKNLTLKQAKKLKDSITKNLVPPPGKAIIYIVRPTIMAFAVPMRLDCDSFQVGWISAKTYLYTILDSGEHTLKSLSENEFHLKVNLEAGKIYYIEQEIRMGILYARTKLKLLNDETGRKELGKCSISGHNTYPNFPLSKDVEKSPPTD